jgi:hypothetical protein
MLRATPTTQTSQQHSCWISLQTNSALIDHWYALHVQGLLPVWLGPSETMSYYPTCTDDVRHTLVLIFSPTVTHKSVLTWEINGLDPRKETISVMDWNSWFAKVYGLQIHGGIRKPNQYMNCILQWTTCRIQGYARYKGALPLIVFVIDNLITDCVSVVVDTEYITIGASRLADHKVTVRSSSNGLG